MNTRYSVDTLPDIKVIAAASTNVPLPNGESFTSDWVERDSSEMVFVGTSDTNFTFKAEFSTDKINVDSSLTYSYIAGEVNVPKRLVIARRFFRIVITNNSGADQTFLRFETAVGSIQQLTTRLDADIPIDSDAIITKAVVSGIGPDGTSYAQTPVDGYVEGASSSTPLNNGETFTSTLIDCTGYQYVSTTLFADQDGTFTGTWYNDDMEVVDTRSFVAPYTASQGLLPAAAIVFGRYLKTSFTNNSGINQTKFALNTKLTNTPPAGQLIGLEQFIPTNATATLNRNILVGKNPDGLYQNVAVNQANALNVDDFIFAIARGEAEGYSSDVKFGYNPDIDTGTVPEDIWGPGGLYTGQPSQSSAAETVQVFSSSSNDTAAGTGARTVQLFGLDENWEEQSETVTLNGTTAVVTSNQWHRIFRAKVITAGSNGSNSGILTARHSTTTSNIFMQIPVGVSNTILGAFTVPAGKRCYIKRIRFSIARANGSAGSALVSFRVRENGGIYNALKYETITTSFPLDENIGGAIILPERADIIMRVEEVSDGNSQISGMFEYILEDI